MRVFLVALMIAMLPLRGWMGDAMAIGMAGQHQEVAAAPMEHGMAAAHEDCAGMAPATLTPAPTDESAAGSMAGASDDCESCSACQVCNSVALATDSPAALALSAPQASPVSVLAQFASFYPQRGHKPPIS
jgi:hypothetical protein